MTTAQTLIEKAFRLINIPGRGASLAAADITAGMEALQDLVDANATFRAFMPGLVRHFFTLP
jgi:hypothetical protein